MTEFSVHYILYASNGTTPVYTFPYVQSDNSPQDPKSFVEITGLRGTGSIVIPGSTQPWDLTLRFLLTANDYEGLIALMDSVQSTIVPQTKYVLKIDRTSGGNTQSYNVMRLTPLTFTDIDFRNNTEEVTISLRVNSW